MASFPTDIVVLDSDGMLHARLARGRKQPRLVRSGSYRFPEGTFTPAVVTPQLAAEDGLREALRRLRLESGKWERLSLLLPDSWFRTNIIELASLPSGNDEALNLVRWTLKKTLPIPPEELRIVWQLLSHMDKGVRLFVLSAIEKTLAHIERIFAEAGFEVVLIEPIGLNVWNAIAAGEGEDTKHRLFLNLREGDFTTALFRGPEPIFFRSRELHGDRSIAQELRLSAGYLRELLQTTLLQRCFITGEQANDEIRQIVADEFKAEVRIVTPREFMEEIPSDAAAYGSALTACAGVFAG